MAPRDAARAALTASIGGLLALAMVAAPGRPAWAIEVVQKLAGP